VFNVPNPHLPDAPPDLTPEHTRIHRSECGLRFHQACLEFSQSLWLQGKPAQALLQLNKSSFAETKAPFPYEALKWFLENRDDSLFIGNPTRHFQHLATRMSGPRAEIRTLQAWACYHLSKSILPENQFPPDQHQVEEESLVIPPLSEIQHALPLPDKSALQFLAISR